MDVLRAPKLIRIPRVANWLPRGKRFQLLLDGALVYQSLALRIIETITIPRPGRVEGQGGGGEISVCFIIHIERRH